MMISQSGEEEGATRPEGPLARRDGVPAGNQGLKAVSLSLFSTYSKRKGLFLPPIVLIQGARGTPGPPGHRSAPLEAARGGRQGFPKPLVPKSVTKFPRKGPWVPKCPKCRDPPRSGSH
jgi:hypothetical protein